MDQSADQTSPKTPALFFYGSLLDQELFACVVGGPLGEVDHSVGWMDDHFVSGIEGLPYPMLAPRPGARATGLVIRALTDQQFERVKYYEGMDYDLVPQSVQTEQGPVTAHIFLGAEQHRSDGAPWSLALWQRATKPLSMAVMERIAPYFGIESLDEIEERWNRVERELIRDGMANHAQSPVDLCR